MEEIDRPGYSGLNNDEVCPIKINCLSLVRRFWYIEKPCLVETTLEALEGILSIISYQ